MSGFVRTNDTGARPSCCPYCESGIPMGLYATCGRDACLAKVLERGPRPSTTRRAPSPEHDPDRSREALFAVDPTMTVSGTADGPGVRVPMINDESDSSR